MRSKLLLLFGPPGVGKTTVIQQLATLDPRFAYISPYITRPLRPGEHDKIEVSDEVLQQMERAGAFVTVTHIYGFKYGTPKKPIEDALDSFLFPVLDWPVQKAHIMDEAFSGQLVGIYLEPPSLATLAARLRARGDAAEKRYLSALAELDKLRSGAYKQYIDSRVVAVEGKTSSVVDKVRREYLRRLPEAYRD